MPRGKGILYTGSSRGIPEQIKNSVFFEGDTAIVKGQGLCYNADYGTLTSAYPGRLSRVEVPSTTNNMWFAGVAVQAYAAKSGGQEIEIYEPGSECEVAVGVNTVFTSMLDPTRMTCSCSAADAGRFTLEGLPGRGTAIALRNKTNIVQGFMDGSAAGAMGASVYTITEAGLGTACGFVSAAVAASQYSLVVVAGATGTNQTEICTVGIYPLVQATGANTVTIATDIADGKLTGYVIEGNPTVWAYLETGEQSGLQEIVVPKGNVAATPVPMVGGTTFIAGTFTLQTANSTDVMADGVINGQKKAFCALGVLTTFVYAITATSDVKGDTTSALTAIAIGAAIGDHAVYEWYGSFGGGGKGLWTVLSTSGAVS